MSDNERPRIQRSEELLHEVLRMLCHFVWNGKPKEGDHVWSIPADNDRDFDLILADAISELVELRGNQKLKEVLMQVESVLDKRSDPFFIVNALNLIETPSTCPRIHPMPTDTIDREESGR